MPTPSADDLIASLYEAAAGRFSWHAALDAVAGSLDCFVVQLIGVDPRQSRLTFSFEGGASPPEGVTDYARTYHRIDPHVRHLGTQPVGNLVAYSRELDAAFIDNNAFYQDFLIPYGVRHTHAAKLYQDERTVVLLGPHHAFGKTPLESVDWETAQRLSFHLVHAMQVFIGLQRMRAEAMVGRETFDRLAVSVMPFDGDRWAAVPRCFIDCNQPAYPTIDGSRQRVRSQPGWRIAVLPTGHFPMVSAPQQLLAQLLALA